jgi:chromosome partitioning protein
LNDSIAVISLKGGTGKTTLAVGLAVSLARRLPKGKRLLLVDADPQANASMTMLNGEAPIEPTLTAVLLADCEARQAIRPSRLPSIDLLPADASLAECTVLLSDPNLIGRELRLRSALEPLKTAYELVIFDAPAQMSLVSINVMNAARSLIVPVDPGIYSAAGLGKLQETVGLIRRHMLHDELQILALVLTKLQPNRANRDFEAQLREHYGPLVCNTTLPYSPKVLEACARHLSVIEHAPACPAAVAFDHLVRELMKHGRQTRDARRNAGKDRRPGGRKRRAG